MEVKQQPQWIYRGEVVTTDSVPEYAIGIVYRITTYNTLHDKEWSKDVQIPDTCKRVYIGKKQLTSTRKSKIGKRAQAKQLLETGDKRKIKRVQRISKDSGWLCYNSSCIPLQDHIKEYPELVVKEILTWCHSKKHMTYEENRQMYLHSVLETDSWNDHIGHFYRKDIVRTVKQQDNDSTGTEK